MEAGEVTPSRASSTFLKKEGGGRAKVYSGMRIGLPRVHGGLSLAFSQVLDSYHYSSSLGRVLVRNVI